MIVLCEEDKTYFAYPFSAIRRNLDLPIKTWLMDENLAFWKVQGKQNCIIGGWESIRMNDIIRYEDGLFDDCEITLPDLVNKLQPRITKILQNADELDGSEEFWENTFLVAQKGKAFEVDLAYVREVNEFAVLGRYEGIVSSVLNATKEQSAIERLKQAAKVLAEISPLQVYPMLVMDTETQTLQVINKE